MVLSSTAHSLLRPLLCSVSTAYSILPQDEQDDAMRKLGIGDPSEAKGCHATAKGETPLIRSSVAVPLFLAVCCGLA
jgi:hypothetical protein